LKMNSSLKLSGPLDLDSFSTGKSSRMSLTKYQIIDENFASGCFGKILLARDAKDKEVVIKRLPRGQGSDQEDILNEIHAGRILNHRNVCQFVEHFSTNEHAYLVFERVYGSDLFHIIEKRNFVPFNERDVRKIFKQILKAIKHSHDSSIVHRDIKLENILMDTTTGRVTVIDFGLCDVVLRGQESQKFCGSLDYVAPEVVSKRHYDGFKADVYSLGIVLYTLLFAEFPFVSKDRLTAIKHRMPQPPIAFAEQKMKRFKISSDAKDLITRMLRPDPALRPSIEEVQDHPFLHNSPVGTP